MIWCSLTVSLLLDGSSRRLADEGECIPLSSDSPSTWNVKKSNAVEEFLAFIYDQIDELLIQCHIQAKSQTCTPCAVPEVDVKNASPSTVPQTLISSHQSLPSQKYSSCDEKENKKSAIVERKIGKAARRIKLFPASDANTGKSNTGKCTDQADFKLCSSVLTCFADTFTCILFQNV